MSDLLHQAGATTKKDQKTKKLHAYIQSADDKLRQFLDQDILATANHRNVLRYSLESCPSLVSPNVNKPSIFTKICMQNTKIVQ
jgi:hypothetical protein